MLFDCDGAALVVGDEAFNFERFAVHGFVPPFAMR
jgi:hypothetical protein